jgi:hypothetical protein
VGPVIEEYEKTISAIEAELKLNRAALVRKSLGRYVFWTDMFISVTQTSLYPRKRTSLPLSRNVTTRPKLTLGNCEHASHVLPSARLQPRLV